MLRLANLALSPDYTEDSIRTVILKKCGLMPDQLLSFSVVRRSVDARNKNDIRIVFTLHLKVRNEQVLLKKCRFLSPVQDLPAAHRNSLQE